MISQQPPLLFRLGRRLSRRGVRGGDRLVHLSRRLGWLERVASYPLGAGVTVDVPLYRRHEENLWDEVDVRVYEMAVVDRLVACAQRMGAPVTLVDAGADIGLISLRVVARSKAVRNVLAFEPNPEPFAFLAKNLARLGISAVARQAALSNFKGRGSLRFPDYDESDHGRFLEADPQGEIEVTRLSSIAVGHGLLIKLDVEGAELDVLQGAKTALREARAFAVVFEANRDVAERTGIDPQQIVNWLRRLRPCRVQVCEAPDLVIDERRPLFAQLPYGRVYNLAIESK